MEFSRSKLWSEPLVKVFESIDHNCLCVPMHGDGEVIKEPHLPHNQRPACSPVPVDETHLDIPIYIVLYLALTWRMETKSRGDKTDDDIVPPDSQSYLVQGILGINAAARPIQGAAKMCSEPESTSAFAFCSIGCLPTRLTSTIGRSTSLPPWRAYLEAAARSIS